MFSPLVKGAQCFQHGFHRNGVFEPDARAREELASLAGVSA